MNALQEIYNEAFDDELQKISGSEEIKAPPAPAPALPGTPVKGGSSNRPVFLPGTPVKK